MFPRAFLSVSCYSCVNLTQYAEEYNITGSKKNPKKNQH